MQNRQKKIIFRSQPDVRLPMRKLVVVFFSFCLAMLIIVLSFFVVHTLPGRQVKNTSLLLSPSPTNVALSLASRPTPTPDPTAVPTPITPTQVPTGSFAMLPPGSALPGEAECANQVHRSSWEPRPQNYAANHRVPTPQQLTGLNPQENKHTAQITGNFTGTTDEIIQWVACRWGVDVNIVRAQAVVESTWDQNVSAGETTDQTLCAPGTWDGKHCNLYWGLLQMTYHYWRSAWPMMRDDTAFAAEYIYGIIRTCYDGEATYTNTPAAGYPRYHAGDIWGCLGTWCCGEWYPQNSFDYINEVKKHYTNKTWLKPGF